MRFNRKKEKDFKFSDYKGENKQGLLTSFDRLEYIYVETKDDEELFKICDTILGGRPVIVNFDKLNGVDCNYMLAFISGVVYALEGQAVRIGPKLFIFGSKKDYEDGSLLQYVEDNK